MKTILQLCIQISNYKRSLTLYSLKILFTNLIKFYSNHLNFPLINSLFTQNTQLMDHIFVMIEYCCQVCLYWLNTIRNHVYRLIIRQYSRLNVVWRTCYRVNNCIVSYHMRVNCIRLNRMGNNRLSPCGCSCSLWLCYCRFYDTSTDSFVIAVFYSYGVLTHRIHLVRPDWNYWSNNWNRINIIWVYRFWDWRNNRSYNWWSHCRR